jgi:hypothetical protein
MYECGQILSRNRLANARRYQSKAAVSRQAEYPPKFFSAAGFFFPRAPATTARHIIIYVTASSEAGSPHAGVVRVQVDALPTSDLSERRCL